MTGSLLTEKRISALIAVLLAVLVLIAYGSMLQNGFVPLDDVLYVQGNDHVLQGLTWESIKWAFTTTDGGNWHPLTWLTHMFDAQLFGNDPFGHHIGNLLLHCVNTLLVFFCFLKMTGAHWRSAAVAALFAVHPMHVESVAWISERKDVLCAFFFLLGILAYNHYARCPHISRYLIVAGCLGLALLCKPMAVTCPFVLLLLDFWPLNRVRDNNAPAAMPQAHPLKLVLEKLPLIALVGLFCWISLTAQQQNMAMSDLSIIPLELRVKNAMAAYVDYLGLAFYPSGLNALYVYSYDISTTYALGCAVLILCMLLAALLCAKRAPYLPVGLFWFAGMLVPVIGIIQVGMQAKADRYVYLPYIGLYLLIVWSISAFISWRPKLKSIAAVIFSIVIIVFVVTTQHQIKTWKDGITLFKRMLEVDPHNDIALYNLGGQYYTLERYKEAVKALELYFKIDPWKPHALQMLTDALVELKEYDKAMKYMKYLIDVMPEDSDSISKLSYISLMRGEVKYSIDLFHVANELGKDDDLAQKRKSSFVALMLERASKQDWNARADYYTGVLSLDPTNAQALFALAQLKFRQGDVSKAIFYLVLAKKYAPDLVQVQNLLQDLLKRLDNDENAIVLRQIAWALATDPSQARRDGETALKFAIRAIFLQGKENALTADALAAALAETGHFGEAQRTADRAVSLAEKSGDNQYANEIRKRQALYLANQPYHTSP